MEIKKTNITKINYYLTKLKNQINENTDLVYVLLRLDMSEANELNDILQHKSVINYILMNIHQEKSIIDEHGDMWRLCISGFKYGAKKNSPRKIGLIAYRDGYLEWFNNNFLSAIFYNSESYNKYNYSKEGKEGVIEYITSDIKKYLENNTKYNSLNYIKPLKEVTKKVKKMKKV